MSDEALDLAAAEVQVALRAQLGNPDIYVTVSEPRTGKVRFFDFMFRSPATHELYEEHLRLDHPPIVPCAALKLELLYNAVLRHEAVGDLSKP